MAKARWSAGYFVLSFMIYTSCLIQNRFVVSALAWLLFEPFSTHKYKMISFPKPAFIVSEACGLCYPQSQSIYFLFRVIPAHSRCNDGLRTDIRGSRETFLSLSVSFKSRGAFWSLMLLTKVSQIEMLKTVDHHLCYHGDCFFFLSLSLWSVEHRFHGTLIAIDSGARGFNVEFGTQCQK